LVEEELLDEISLLVIEGKVKSGEKLKLEISDNKLSIKY
jgi:hypothetical protein